LDVIRNVVGSGRGCLDLFQNRNLSSILMMKPANRCPKLVAVSAFKPLRDDRILKGELIMTNAKLVGRNPIADARSFDVKLLWSYGVVSVLLLILIHACSNPAAADLTYLTSNMPMP
jgi:hypothetical protein